MRPASTPWTLAGISNSVAARMSRYAPRSPASAPDSANSRTISSTKKGFPAVRVRMAAPGAATEESLPRRSASRGVERLAAKRQQGDVLVAEALHPSSAVLGAEVEEQQAAVA